MEEAAVRDAFDGRRAALKEDELLETTSLRIRHATEVERLQHRICTAALGVRGEEQASAVTPTFFYQNSKPDTGIEGGGGAKGSGGHAFL